MQAGLENKTSHYTTLRNQVYIIQSIPFPDKYYVGLTEDAEKRLTKHNEGGSPYTSKFKPWKLVVTISLENEEKAREFERD